MEIVSNVVSREELLQIAGHLFGDMVKGVVDADTRERICAVVKRWFE